MTRIFISHSHADEEIASLLVDFLLAALTIKSDDIRCTSVPGHQLPFGTSIGEQLKSDLNETTGLIALINQWHESYVNKPENIKENGNIAWRNNNPTNESTMILRGGSWDNNPVSCRSAHRVGSIAGRSDRNLCFRVAVSRS